MLPSLHTLSVGKVIMGKKNPCQVFCGVQKSGLEMI